MLGDDPGTMVEAGGGDDGRKRPRIPTSSSPKKAKRLSSLALRALAALEHDGGISCSDDERDAKDSRHRDISHFASGVMGVSEKSGIENTAAHSAIDTVESVVALTERNAVLHSGIEAGRNFDDLAHELPHTELKGSGEDAEERNNPKICQNSLSPDAGHVRNVHESNERSPDMPGAVETTFDDVPKDTSPVAGKKIIAEDAHESLAVADAKLGNSIQDKMDLNCVFDSKVSELMRCIRSQASGLITGTKRFPPPIPFYIFIFCPMIINVQNY